MRVRADDDYVGYVRGVLDDTTTTRQDFPGYDLRFFDTLHLFATRSSREKRRWVSPAFSQASRGHGRANTIPQPWTSVDALQLRSNASDVDWVSSPTSINEVGSIHTIQGYDLNYAGVIIANDLRYNAASGCIYFDRTNYHDPRGTTNNRMLGISYSDEHPAVREEHLCGVAHAGHARNVLVRVRVRPSAARAPPVSLLGDVERRPERGLSDADFQSNTAISPRVPRTPRLMPAA